MLSAGPHWPRCSATAPLRTDEPTLRTHFPAKAKQVIYLHMVGGPAQMDLYDYKPRMNDFYDVDLPDSVRMGQRLTTMTSGQARFPIAPSKYQFARHGRCGMWVSELLPYTARMVDDMCFIRSMNTEAINHEPAICCMQTGNQITGRPCLGSWASYGLGSLNQNLPTFVVLVAQPTQYRTVASDLGPVMARRLPAGRARRRFLPQHRRPDPVHQQPARRHRRGPPPWPRRSAPAQRDELSASPATPRRTPAFSNTSWPSACRPACRSLPTWPTSRRRPTLCTATTPAIPARSPTPSCWPGAWSSAACVSSRSTTTTGTRTPTWPAACPSQCKDVDQAC